MGLADLIIHYVTSEAPISPKSRCMIMTKKPSSCHDVTHRLCRRTFRAHAEALIEMVTSRGFLFEFGRRIASAHKPRLAICTTYRPEPALAVMRSVRDRMIKAEVPLMLENRNTCRGIAEQFWQLGLTSVMPTVIPMMIAWSKLLDQYDIDYIILLDICEFSRPAVAGNTPGRIINLHHGCFLVFQECVLIMMLMPRGCSPMGNLPFHRSGTGRRQSDHCPIHLHRTAGNAFRRNRPQRTGRQRTDLFGRRRATRVTMKFGYISSRHSTTTILMEPFGSILKIALLKFRYERRCTPTPICCTSVEHLNRMKKSVGAGVQHSLY
ncbi:MAG: hypothetical protein R3C28_01720 [Pirellulaceae bacterium]